MLGSAPLSLEPCLSIFPTSELSAATRPTDHHGSGKVFYLAHPVLKDQSTTARDLNMHWKQARAEKQWVDWLRRSLASSEVPSPPSQVADPPAHTTPQS